MIRVEHLSKTFKLYARPSDRLREILFGRVLHRNFDALKNVSFSLAAGETLGIIGQNGAGKSTLLKLLTGVLLPDAGTIDIDGKTTGLLELGTGFNHEFPGVDNIYLNGALLNMTRQEIDRKFSAIVGFAELGDFIDEPVKTYSSGMLMRLAFSIAIHAEPRCFVVDEALAVGDAYFQQKCFRKIKCFKEQGGSIVLVSHDLNAIKVLCNSAMLLDCGEVVEMGSPDAVVDRYTYLLAQKSQQPEHHLSRLN